MYPKTIPYVPSDSFKPTLLNSWEAFDLAYDRTARVTVLNGVVYLSGIVKNTINANAFNGFTPMITIPNHLSPKYSINFVALSNKGPIRIAIAGRNTVSVGETGNVNPQNILSYTDIAWVSLDGLIYPIMD
jgi:hypothetical protein